MGKLRCHQESLLHPVTLVMIEGAVAARIERFRSREGDTRLGLDPRRSGGEYGEA